MQSVFFPRYSGAGKKCIRSRKNVMDAASRAALTREEIPADEMVHGHPIGVQWVAASVNCDGVVKSLKMLVLARPQL